MIHTIRSSPTRWAKPTSSAKRRTVEILKLKTLDGLRPSYQPLEAAMKWVTRANVKVDRVACPWLIRTFVDRDAEFLFVPVGEVEVVARKTGPIPYDVAGVELGHHGAECSFDAIVKKHNVKDEAIGRLALIVRGADTPHRDLTPESRGLEAIAEGFKRLAAAE